MPKTLIGKWSVWLAAAMLLLIFLSPILTSTWYKGVVGGNTVFEDIALRPGLAIPMLVGVLSGLTALVTGLVALIKYQERAALVYVSTALGALLLLFMIGDAFSPA